MSRLRVEVFAAPTFAARAAERIARLLEKAVARADCRAQVDGGARASLALAGGSTPAATYRELARLALPWQRIELWLGDERCVPRDDPRSNARMARENLVRLLPAPGPAAVHEVDGADADPESAAKRYGERLPARLDVVLLGLGEDGHTASIFPGSPTFDADARAALVRGPKPPVERVTLTPRALREARELVVLATGAGKAESVSRALADGADPREVPAALAARGTWLLDEEAAALLPGGAR